MTAKIKLYLYLVGTLLTVVLTFLHPLFSLGTLCFVGLLFRDARIHLKSSQLDALTGLPNLYRLNQLRSFYRKSPSLSIVYIDLNDLKQINDYQGHNAGNDALVEVAKYLQHNCRKGEIPYRIGGDEFLLISTSGNAAELQQRFLSAHAALRHIGISFGVATGSGKDLDALIHTADRNMYAMKNRTT